MIVLIFFLGSLINNIIANPCDPREAEYGIVCVCNSTYCDTTPELEALSSNKYQIYTTSKLQPGFNSQVGYFSKTENVSSNVIKVGTEKYQKIVGFGGAFTDATSLNIKSLPGGAQRKLMESYFGESGIGYSLCRVPIGGTDFSLRPYSYDDHPDDDTLSTFSLQMEDLTLKIPLILEARTLRANSSFKLFASAWTAPPWMKTKDIWTGFSLLSDKYYQLWADYIVKFFNAYEKYSIDFWGLTTGNEPMNGFFFYLRSKINSMGWIPQLQARWISQNLGPTLDNASYGDIQIFINDDNRLTIPYYVPLMLNDENTLKYVDGVGVHWYRDDEVPTDVFGMTKSDKKDITLLMTEACYFLDGTEPGSWPRGAGYAGSIIEYLQNGFVGWVDWNMALNLTGGPTYIDYLADSPILVNATAEEFYKQPMFYAMGHFSKFVLPGSVRLDVEHISVEKEDVRSVAFLRPDNLVALTVFNNGSSTASIQVQSNDSFSDIFKFAANSLSTILFEASDEIKE